MNTIDKVLYINENKVVIYLVDRQFVVETNNSTALQLTIELLAPYFKKLNSEQGKKAA